MGSPIGAARSFVLPEDFFERTEARRIAWIDGLHPARPETFAGVREKLLWIMDPSRDPRAIDALTTIVHRDQSVDVQRAALYALYGTRDPASIPGLLAGLASTDLACRVTAILGLQQLKAREAVPGLIELLDDTRRKDFKQIRESAAEALVAIRDERGLEPLRAAARHGWPPSRRRLRRHAEALAAELGY